VYGHGFLAQTLLKHGLLDEMRLSVFPLLVGRGRLLFRDSETTRLTLIDATRSPTGVVVLRYQPVDVDGERPSWTRFTGISSNC
jgi:dihydrofolate reductase